jgi:aryl-alcohol dehydrogenase-like predicted oxidoreductase
MAEEYVQGLLNESKVEFRRLGKSGLVISNPVLGAMSFGTDKWLDWVMNEDKALPLLKAAWNRGINTWDTGLYSYSSLLNRRPTF